VLGVIYSDLDDDEVSKDLEDVLCTRAMWRKVIQGAPASYSNSLAALYCPDMDAPTVKSVFLAPKRGRKSLHLLIPMEESLGCQECPKKLVLFWPSQKKWEPQTHATWCTLVIRV